MIRVQIVKLNQAGTIARCRVYRLAYNATTLITVGNIELNKPVPTNYIQNMPFLDCISKTYKIDNKVYNRLEFHNQISNDATKILSSIFDHNLDQANILIRELITLNPEHLGSILIEIKDAYYQYLYSHMSISFEISSFVDQIDVFEKQVFTRRVLPFIDEDDVADDTVLKHKIHLDFYRQMPPVRELSNFELNRYLSKERLIKVYTCHANSKLQFGPYQDKTLLEVITLHPEYIMSRIIYLNHFAVSESTFMLLSAHCNSIKKSAFLINRLKLRIYDYQNDLRDALRVTQQEERKERMWLYSEGYKTAFEDDTSNLWNID